MGDENRNIGRQENGRERRKEESSGSGGVCVCLCVWGGEEEQRSLNLVRRAVCL